MSWEDESNIYHSDKLIARFWNNLTIIGDCDNECWNWNKSISKAGYGTILVTRLWGKGQFTLNSHRYAYLFLIGSIPEGLSCLHECDNKLCCNPDHLFIGTASDNAIDMYAKGKDGIEVWRGQHHTEQAKFNMREAWKRRREREVSNYG